MDGLDGSRIGKSEGYLDPAIAFWNHLCGETFAEPSEFHEEPAVIGMNLKRFDSHAIDKIGGVGLSDDFSEGSSGTATNGQLHAVSCTEGHNRFLQSARYSFLTRHLCPSLSWY